MACLQSWFLLYFVVFRVKRGRKELEDHLGEKDEWLVHAFSLITEYISWYQYLNTNQVRCCVDADFKTGTVCSDHFRDTE